MPLISPGVEVSVVNESFYSSAGPGTVPAIFVASASNKMNAAGTDIAAGTLKRNAERPYLVSSQRELAELFGDPTFYVGANNTPIHGSELNEYGLHAAYSYLGSNNRAWVMRADLDLNQLMPATQAPTGDPLPGTYWLDVKQCDWGTFEWNEPLQRFEKVTPIAVYEEGDMSYGTINTNGTDGYIPKASIGSVGSYAVVFGSTVARVFYRNSNGVWVLLGSNPWKASFPTVGGKQANPVFSNASAILSINGVNVTVLSTDTVHDVAANITGAGITGITGGTIYNRLVIYSNGTAGGNGDVEISGDLSLLSELDITVDTSGNSKTYYCPQLHIDKHMRVPAFKRRDATPRPSGSAWIKTTALGGGANWSLRGWNDVSKGWDIVDVPIYETAQDAIFQMDRTGGGANIPVGDVYARYNVSEDANVLATFKLYKRALSGPTVVTGDRIGSSGVTTKTYNIMMSSTDYGSPSLSSGVSISFTTTGTALDSEIVAGAIAGAGVPNVSARVTDRNELELVHELGGEIRIIDDSVNPVLNQMGLTPYVNINTGARNLYYAPGTDGYTTPLVMNVSGWSPTADLGDRTVSFYIAGSVAASSLPDDGRLWYNPTIDEVDIMIHNGDTWVGYHNYNSMYQYCDPAGPIVSASMPTYQSDGTPLVEGDLWIETVDIDNYPKIYRFNEDMATGSGMLTVNIANGWELLDTTDQTTDNGVLFADARYNTTGQGGGEPGSIVELLTNDYLDPDAPDPALYPRGMLLWNTRRSGFNVKKFVRNHIDMLSENTRYYHEPTNDYYPHRWVTESSNQENGKGSFGRIAQRRVVVQALQSMIASNEDIRDNERYVFNLMATPGYPELIGEMVSMNYDRKLSTFIVGDCPARLSNSSTDITEWATNKNQATEDNDYGLVSADDYMAVYYPWGLTSDNFGRNVAVPPSYMMLSTIAQSDRISYPWFAPAGVRRGGIINASSVGYITSESEFQPISLNEGQRDTLYENNVNPITYMNNLGIVAYGQKTRSRGSSAMDRINVSRLVIHLRHQLDTATRPFVFQPNDEITRDEVRNVVNGLLVDLMAQRALYDFMVVCDESNNTPTRIDRNELWIDVAIEPIRAVEFIYIPLRIKNTGSI